MQNDLAVRSAKKIDEIRLASKGLSFSSEGNNIFSVYPKTYGTDTIKLYSKGRLVHTAVFNVDLIPDPIVRIARSLDTVMSVQQIQLNPFLSVSYAGTNYKCKLYVFRFHMTVEDRSDGITGAEVSISNRFTEKQLSLIKLLRAGDKLHFTQIAGLSPDGRVFPMPPFAVIIK
jgi:hypothetical protein